jgi:ABC-2 type transport system permease protein
VTSAASAEERSSADAPRATGPLDVRGRRPALLRGVVVVLSRELAGWFDAPIAWLAVAAALFASTSWFMNGFFLAGRLDMTPFFEVLPLVYLLFVPALAMRQWSEDLRTRTFELWMTLPLRPGQVVLGKYLAACVVLALFLAGTLGIVALLCALGAPDLGRIACGYAGALLLGAQLLAIGQLCSALTADQVVAFVAAALAGAVLLGTGDERVVAVLDAWWPSLGAGSLLERWLSAEPHYAAFVAGRIPLGSAIYFAATSGACLAVNAWTAARART